MTSAKAILASWVAIRPARRPDKNQTMASRKLVEHHVQELTQIMPGRVSCGSFMHQHNRSNRCPAT